MTSWLAHYGVIAVFLLMLVDAVFPAASELVMLYGGAYVARLFVDSTTGASELGVPFGYRR